MKNSEKVTQWITDGMDFTQGVNLLVAITGKSSFYNQFNGNKIRLAPKLAYEICKASGLADVRTWKSFIASIIGEGKLPDEDSENSKSNPDQLHEPGHQGASKEEYSLDGPTQLETLHQDYPPIMRRVIHEYASCFQERSRIHTTMTEMPESNTDSVCAARKELFDCIKSLSTRLQLLYETKLSYESDGTLPDPEILFPSENKTEKEVDLNTLDQQGLKKAKILLQNQNSTGQIMLDFQSKKTSPTKNPMPQGPKRIKIESRLKNNLVRINEIDMILLKYAIKE